MVKNQLEDPQPCIEIEEKLERYAEATKDWHIARRHYTSQYGNKYDFNDMNPYPYDDETERVMISNINAYLYSLDDHEQKLANGRLLFHYKDYLSQPFAKHAVDLISHSIALFPLKDDDKVQFLEYLFKADKQDEFNPRILYKLANYNPNDNLEATNRLYNKAQAYFDGTARKNDKKVAILYGMFRVFAQNVEGVTPEAAVNYAEIYFGMADRSSKGLEATVLKDLAIKTPKSLELARQCKDAAVVDKEVIKGIFRAYGKHVNSHSSFNEELAKQMEVFAQDVIKVYQYNLQEAMDLVDAVRPPELDEKGKKIRDSKKRTALSEMAERLESFVDKSDFRKSNPIRDIDRDNPPRDLGNDRVVDYATYLFGTARRFKNVDFKTAGLYSLMTRSGDIDKELVLDVASTYADTYTAKALDEGLYNSSFHEKMTRMFQHIVTEYDYSAGEVNELTHRLSKGAEKSYDVSISSNDYEEYGMEAAYSEKRGHELFQDMARSIDVAYTQMGDISYRNDSIPVAKSVLPIVLQKTGGGNSGN